MRTIPRNVIDPTDAFPRKSRPARWWLWSLSPLELNAVWLGKTDLLVPEVDVMRNGAALGLATWVFFVVGACAHDDGLRVEEPGGTAPAAALLARDSYRLVLKLHGELESAFFASGLGRSAAESPSSSPTCRKVRAMGRSIEHLPEDRRLIFQHSDGQLSAVSIRCFEELALRRSP